jgi:ferritin-like metal-binding protein YciE
MMKTIEAGAVRDAALVIAAAQVEHFEVASYISLQSLAHSLDRKDVVSLLDQTLTEEKKAAAKVIEIGEKNVHTKVVQHAVAAR